jgi:hypothetical protein
MSIRIFLMAAVAATSLPVFAQATAMSPDEAAVRQIVANLEADQPDPHVSPTLDWENAFGIRYDDLKKRDAFYVAVVKPQFKTATDSTLETKVSFVTPDVAVADTYWHVVGQIYRGETKPGPDRWGRTTYIFRKKNGAWVEVIERVADLRLPYYKHITEVPKSAPVPAETLQSYAGRYASPPGATDPATSDVAVQGDHLTITTRRGVLLAIPTSQTEFLVFFSPDDTAEYYKAKFDTRNGAVSYALSEAWGEPLSVLQKQPPP